MSQTERVAHGRGSSRNRRRWLLRWSLAVVIIVLLAMSITGYLVVRSQAFHRYLLAKMEQKADVATGGRTEIADFTFRWSSLTLKLYDLTFHGTEPPGSPALFRATRLEVNLSVDSLLRRTISLDELMLDHPVLHLLVNKEGKSNIPEPAAKQNQESNRERLNVFGLAVKHFVLSRGEIDCNNRAIPMDAELRDLRSTIEFDVRKTRYEGSLSYGSGQIRFGDSNPLRHGLEAQFSADPSGISLRHLRLTAGSSRVTAQAELKDYSHPLIEGSYQATVSMDTVRDVFRNPSLPLGQVNLEGTLRYQSRPKQSFLDGLALEGRLTSSSLLARSSQAHVNIRSLRGRYSLQSGVLKVDKVNAALLDGALNGSVTVQHLAGQPDVRTQADLHAISLEALSASMAATPLAEAPITGKLDGRFEAAWGGTPRQLKVQSDVVVAAQVGSDSESPVPVNASAHLKYDAAHDVLSLNQTYLRAPHTEVQLNGTLSEHSRLAVEVHAADLHEADLLAYKLRSTVPQLGTAGLLGLRGKADFQGSLQGSPESPRITGELTASNLEVKGTRWQSLRTAIALSPSEVSLQRTSLVGQQHGRIDFSGTLGLQHWKYERSNPLSVRASVRALSLDELQRAAGLRYPVHGRLSAQLSASGSVASPEGQGSLKLTQAVLWDQPVQKIGARFKAQGGTVQSSFSIAASAGKASGDFSYKLETGAYTTRFDASGVHLDQLEMVKARGLGLHGVLGVSAHGSGTLMAPQLEAQAEIPELQFGRQTLQALEARVQVGDRRARLE